MENGRHQEDDGPNWLDDAWVLVENYWIAMEVNPETLVGPDVDEGTFAEEYPHLAYIEWDSMFVFVLEYAAETGFDAEELYSNVEYLADLVERSYDDLMFLEVLAMIHSYEQESDPSEFEGSYSGPDDEQDFVKNENFEGWKNVDRNNNNLLKAAWTAAKAAVPGSEFAAALEVLDGCNSLSIMLAWAKKQQANCLLFNDDDEKAEACLEHWRKQHAFLESIWSKHCK